MDIKITAANNKTLQISTAYDKDVITAIKNIPGRQWLAEKKVWVYPDTDANTQQFLSELYKLEKFNYPELPVKTTSVKSSSPLKTMISYLKLKEYSPKTIRVYTSQVQWFFKRTALRPEETTTEDITLYLEKIKNLTGSSRTFTVQCISALKCYYSHGLKIPNYNPAYNIPLPKKEHKYPDILSRNEVNRIIKEGTYNIKHQFLLSLIYSCGLRVSEAVNLQLSDLDTDRGMIHIRAAKGKKDRYVMLSEEIAFIFERYKNRVFLQEWLFPVQKKTVI